MNMDCDGWKRGSTSAGKALLSMVGAAVLAACATGTARAHDEAQWIMDQRLRSQTGEWCCGQGDCNPVEKSGFKVTANGYQLMANGETIPFGETMPLSVDGRLWVCRRPNGSRRCVFDRPPGS
jgi:hypothetical protein